jgi:hypothetical protein
LGSHGLQQREPRSRIVVQTDASEEIGKRKR